LGGDAPLQLLKVSEIAPADVFWAPKQRVYRDQSVPHSWKYMQWNLRALRKGAGEKVEGDLNGTWDEANLHKFLETVAYSLAQKPDPALEKRADEVIDLLARCQQPNGYLHVYITNTRKPQWDPAFLDGSHDGYVLGHMIQAALAYHEATGKRKFLDLAIRAADEACQHFGTHPGFCGHAELEMALVQLYRVTKNYRHLELARSFVEWRGHNKVKPAGPTPRAYFQDGAPVREQYTLEGHAVRAIFFATGVADLGLATGDADYRLAADRFWDSTARRRMAITGAVGPRAEHEAFGEDYELPNDGYYESCAACGLADFAQRMFLLERQGDYADTLERVLYNAVLHGMALDGTNSYYQNPLSDKDHPRYNSWVCCPPNLSRTLLKAGQFAYAHGPREIFVNLYLGGEARVPLAGAPVALKVETDYPWNGAVKITVNPSKPARFALNLRKPGWSSKATVRVNGQEHAIAAEAGYFRLDGIWRAGEVVELTMDMPVRRMVAHRNIRDCRGKVALQRGPLVYGFEGLDNEGNPRVALGAQPGFQTEWRPDFLGGVTVIKGTTAEGKPFTAIPFYTLANRQKSAQEVWVEQRGLALDESWWEGRLYRTMEEVTPKPKDGK
jgi:DUF1680 family protein